MRPAWRFGALLLVLSACGGPSTPPAHDVPATAPTPSAAVPAAPTPPPAPLPRDLLYEIIVVTPQGTRAGLRVYTDGEMQNGHGSRTITWVTYGILKDTLVDALRAELDGASLRDLPARLPSPPTSTPAPTAQYTFLTSAGPRTVRTESFGQIKVPAFDQVESILRRGRERTVHHTRWQVHRDPPLVGELPCDPLQVTSLRGIAAKLIDPALRPAAPSEASPLLSVDWYAGPLTWRTTVHTDGRIQRIDELGVHRWTQVPANAQQALVQALDHVDAALLRRACAP